MGKNGLVGHRASSCEHTDRQLILIKKKGRPATQCLKCRELRIVRQLHRRCECLVKNNDINKIEANIKSNDTNIKSQDGKSRKRHKTLRPLAPKQDMMHDLQELLDAKTLYSLHNQDLLRVDISCRDEQKYPTHEWKNVDEQPPEKTEGEKTCCTPVKRSDDNNQEPLKKCCSTQTAFTSLLPNNGARPAMSCLGPAAKNQQGEIIRLVTCRCGDNCACIGCDAHPSRAMKEGRNDVYIGFNESHTRKLSISAITWPSSANPDPSSPKPDFPETILAEDGTMLCGCGCAKKFEDCSSCILRLCHSEYS
ncbi:hypothetical protein AB4K20DRAFT_1811874 [Rhizopus microsporus]